MEQIQGSGSDPTSRTTPGTVARFPSATGGRRDRLNEGERHPPPGHVSKPVTGWVSCSRRMTAPFVVPQPEALMYFFVRSENPRPTFHFDMTSAERAIVVRHTPLGRRWRPTGVAIVFGPMMEPMGVYGIGVYQADDEAHVRAMLDSDPASALLTYAAYPMPRAGGICSARPTGRAPA